DGGLLAAAQVVHVHGKLLDRHVVQTLGPGGHHAVAAVGDGLHQGGLVTAEDPRGGVQRRGADLDPGSHAADTVFAVAGHTVLFVHRLAGLGLGGVGGTVGEREHVFRHLVDLGGGEDAVLAEGGHARRATGV